MSNNQKFIIGGKTYEIVRKEYDDSLFNTNVYEIIEAHDAKSGLTSSTSQFIELLLQIDFCTFRGRYNIEMIHLLEKNGFYFIDDFLTIKTSRKEFLPLKKKLEIPFEIIKGDPSPEQENQILDIEKSVYDFSSFQADPRIEQKTSIERNTIRVKSHFQKNGHILFLGRDFSKSEKSIGFLQFVLSENTAECVNGAIHSDKQNFFYGPILYSNSFSYIFEKYPKINFIYGGLGFNNTRVLNIFQKLNFKIIDREVHLRKISK